MAIIPMSRATKEKDPGRYEDGWRQGKPVEDPDKLKSWGWISAKPSEYLIYLRDGKVHPRLSGQGARVFKMPWETVAIVPTTLQKIRFEADQITRETVGVTVSGIAVYRIVDPRLAFRCLNFSYGERAGEKLADTLTEMFVGASRRLIANLSLEACLTRRKESIATFLMEEISPVVSGQGASGDDTDRGWGVVIDTIEIQEVRIQSEQVFEDLQAPFRAELAAKAALADLERQRQVAEQQAETDRKVAEMAITSERERRLLRARAEAEAAESEASEQARADRARADAMTEELRRQEELKAMKVAMEERLACQEAEREARVKAERARLAQEHELARIRAEESRRRIQAEAEAQAVEAERAMEAARQAAELTRLTHERERQAYQAETEQALKDTLLHLELQMRRQQAELKRADDQIELDRQRGLAEIEQIVSHGRAMSDLVNHGLPQIAQAFRQSFGTVHYTHLGGGEADGGPVGMVAQAFTQLLTVARGFGFELGGIGQGAASDGSAGHPPALPAAEAPQGALAEGAPAAV